MPIETLNGERLFFEDHHPANGSANATAIVFCHGGGGSHMDWWRQAWFFRAKGYRCVVMDQRGCGLSGGAQSGTPGAVADNDVFYKDTLAIMDRLGISKAHIVGHSMGGWNCSGVALNQPARAVSIVMAATTFGFVTEASQRWGAHMLQQLTSGVDMVTNSRTSPQQERWRKAHPDLAFLREEIRGLFTPRVGVRGLDTYRRMAQEQPRDYSQFSVPSLFIAAADDPLQYPWLVKATAKAVHGAKLVHVPDAGHSVQWEAPEAVNDAMLSFFKQVERR